MRQPQNQRRGRGRGGRKPSGRNQTFDSNGPQGRIRGNAQQVHEKYLNQARDAASGGDRILSENLFQHADHYYRIMLASGIVQPQSERREDQSDDQPDDQQQPQQQGRGKRRKPNGKADRDQGGDGRDEDQSDQSDDGSDDEPQPAAQDGGGKPRRGRPKKKPDTDPSDQDESGHEEAANVDAS